MTAKKRFDLYDMEALHDPVKVGFLIPQTETELESPQPESHILNASDEIFFYGVNSSSETLVIRIARKVNHEADALVLVKLHDGKTYRLNKTSGYQNSCSDAGREFTCGDLKMHYISPMRYWRIFFNGLLREATEGGVNPGKLVYVKFAFIWAASSDVFDMTTDISSAAIKQAVTKSKEETLSSQLEKLRGVLDCYAQTGVIHGTITVDGVCVDRHVYLFGERIRLMGNTALENGAQFTDVLGRTTKDGSIVHITEVTIPGVVQELRFGFVVLPFGSLEPFSSTELHVENTDGKNKDVRAVFRAADLKFKLDGSIIGERAISEGDKQGDAYFTLDYLDFQMNELKGNGILIRGAIPKSSPSTIPEVQLKELPKVSTAYSVLDVPFVVHFSEDLCGIAEITGGKGSSLGKLTQLSKEYQKFIVPNGIVVTTSAYDEFVNDDIRKAIRLLEDVLYGKTSGDVKDFCQKVMEETIKASIPGAVHQAIVDCLQKTFGDKLHTMKFAIRSSATGEDTEQMSAAGQMDTYLGVTGLNEIMSAVKKCWASQFGFVAVEYKRQNGQVINSPMAVVIQEMVPCDVAGVFFTCDPLTGNPAHMSIAANYGLGESVVSGTEEPDTIELARDDEDRLEIKNKIIGAKSHRVIVADGEGTHLLDVDEKEKTVCCLSDDMALRLGHVAVQIEKRYRSKRDIEWGFWNNNLHIFQSRPVTSGTGETDYEIDHEKDAPMRVEDEYFTVCNIGDVMPGAMSPLGLDILFKNCSIALQRKSKYSIFPPITARYFPKIVQQMYYHVMFEVADMFVLFKDDETSAEAVMISMFGFSMDKEDLTEMAKDRSFGLKQGSKLKMVAPLLRTVFMGDEVLEKSRKRYGNYHVPVENIETSKEIFDLLMRACDEIAEAAMIHSLSAMTTSIWDMAVFKLIGKARGGINPEAYRDLARLLESISNVESADVPASMQSLAYHIGKEMNPEEFKEKDPEELLQWLQTCTTEVGTKFRDFLDRHGHRCLNEYDIRSTPWGTDPKLLIQFLKNLVGSVSEDTSEKKAVDFDKLLNDLGLPLSLPWRMLLKRYLLPRCRKAVQLRESTKSFRMKIEDDWRKCYWYLAKILVQEGRIPDEDLMFFMTLEEIRELVESRSSKIISKAKHRRRRHPILNKYMFQPLAKGFPKPVNADDTPIEPTEEDFQMQGIAVSQGVAKGFARIAYNLEEASHLKQGEILLTYTTDIGWTPYFPLLAGVITELGSLISHGSVISREYGIPCIIGMHGATRKFQTGDYVLLDGNKGLLQKLPPPQ